MDFEKVFLARSESVLDQRKRRCHHHARRMNGLVYKKKKVHIFFHQKNFVWSCKIFSHQ